ncbi:disulfide bond formation protein B [Tsuneonella sp. YG55]|uniref:Disulfide bond formation protein B n=1 Tax=Tsuneonella litorea TaxID=2976475 RepID=A0A9X2VZE9_9SPHN|nr:disulfide bond formation protein B [Tsuneonella litorea]MCT2557818.1 disulfide bond formation protein B [Tsuneonella litorea]
MPTRSDRLAQRLALAVPALLLGGAYLGEYGFGLYPCEMCWWQRYPHFAAVGLALLSTVAAPKRMWIALAGFAILVSGGIGAFHAGVEYGWWEGLTACSSLSSGGGDPLEAIMNAPLVRCDEVQWSFFGISLAGWNALISTATALAILRLLGLRSET